MVFGDVLSILAVVMGIPLTTWAMVVACRLVFPSASERAADRLRTAPILAFFVGLGIVVLFGFIGVVEISAPPAPIKLIGFATLSTIFAISTLGCAGISQIAADRIQAQTHEGNSYASYVKGTAFVIVACMSPLVGWLFIGPIALITSIGAGVLSLLSRRSISPSAA